MQLCHTSRGLATTVVSRHVGTKLFTCEPVLLGAHTVGVLDRAAEVEHRKHGENHHSTLEQQGDLKLLPYPAERQPINYTEVFKIRKTWALIFPSLSSPEEYAQDVGYEQDQTDSGGEALSVAAPLDLLVLR